MNKKYTITYLPLFYNDMNKITKYIAKNLKNRIAADNLISEVMQKIEKRAYNPNCYEKYSSSIKRKNTYYRLYVKNYTIFYIIKDNIMEVRRILYNKRNFDNLI